MKDVLRKGRLALLAALALAGAVGCSTLATGGDLTMPVDQGHGGGRGDAG
jgi:hypothetical protein